MKKINVFIISFILDSCVLILLSDFVLSQTFKLTYNGKIVTDSTLNIYLSPDTSITVPLVVYNISNNSITVKVKKIIKDTVAGSQNSFCWGTFCFFPYVYTSPDSITIYSYGNNSSFYGDYTPFGKIGTTTIMYVFFDMHNKKDSSYFSVNYIAKPNSVFDLTNVQQSSGVSNIYPNPFSLQTTISYVLTENADISLKIYDIFGNQVSCLINQIMSKGTYKLNYKAENLSAGFYYCVLFSHNQILSVKKFSVIH